MASLLWLMVVVGFMFGLVSLVGLFRPAIFAFGGPDFVRWFADPPTWLRSAAWTNVFVGVLVLVNPLIALGVLVLWARYFPRHVDAVADTWLTKAGVAAHVPWRMNPTNRWLEANRALDLVSWAVVADVAAATAVFVGVWIYMESFQSGLIVVGLVAAGAAWAKWSGNDRKFWEAIGVN